MERLGDEWDWDARCETPRNQFKKRERKEKMMASELTEECKFKKKKTC